DDDGLGATRIEKLDQLSDRRERLRPPEGVLGVRLLHVAKLLGGVKLGAQLLQQPWSASKRAKQEARLRFVERMIVAQVKRAERVLAKVLLDLTCPLRRDVLLVQRRANRASNTLLPVAELLGLDDRRDCARDDRVAGLAAEPFQDVLEAHALGCCERHAKVA